MNADRNGIDRIPSREPNHGAGHERGHGAEQVAHDVQHRAPDIEGLLASAQNPRGAEVHEKTEGGYEHDGGPVDRLRRGEAPAGLDTEVDDDGEHERDVEQRGEDLGALEAVGMPERRRLAAYPRGRRAEPERRRIGDHVARVSEQRQGIRPPARHGLDDGEERREAQGHDQSLLAPRTVIVTVPRLRHAESALRSDADATPIQP